MGTYKNLPKLNQITFLELLKNWLLIALGVTIAANVLPGISYDKPSTLVFVVLLMSVLNLFVKPLLILFTLPFIILTLGIGVLLINAILFVLVGKIIPGFTVESFWTAFWSALIVSVITFLANMFLRTQRQKKGNGSQGGHAKKIKDDDDVIDI